MDNSELTREKITRSFTRPECSLEKGNSTREAMSAAARAAVESPISIATGERNKALDLRDRDRMRFLVNEQERDRNAMLAKGGEVA